VFCTAPAAYLLPAGSTTQVQFNNAGAFGGSSNFVYDNVNNVLSVPKVSSVSGGVILSAFAPPAGTPAGFTSVLGANTLDGLVGGRVDVISGVGNGNSGPVNVASGVPTAAGANSGAITVISGNSTLSTSGGITVASGTGATTGIVAIRSGAASTGASGNFILASGTGATNSGSSTMSSGGGGTGNSGSVTLSTGSSSAVGGQTGNLIFSTGAKTGTGSSGSMNVNLGNCASGTGGSITMRPGAGLTPGNIRLRSSVATDVIQITDVASVSQLGFFAATPVPKQTTAAASDAYAAGSIVGVFHEDDTYGGYTIGQIVTALKAYGLLT
jgi:hypothetical protein